MKPSHSNQAGEFREDDLPFPEGSEAEIEAAWQYERNFVPTLFGPWTANVIQAADIRPQHRILDVACGTGILARDIAKQTGAEVTGLDISPGMLSVAGSLAPQIQWQPGDACRIPFENGSFDRVVCQFGLMFFSDPVRALNEMRRVLSPEGRITLAVWNEPVANPGFRIMIRILADLAGERAADALRAPFSMGDEQKLTDLFHAAGLESFELLTQQGTARFPDLGEFVNGELRGWLPVMEVMLDETTISQVHQACTSGLSDYIGTDGGLAMPVSAHLVCSH